MKKLSLHWQIFIAIGLGLCVGFILTFFPWGKSFAMGYIKPFGTMFINALKLISIPLVFASLIKGISDLKDLSKLSKIGVSTIAIYLISTVIAVSVGLISTNIIKPGKILSEQMRTELLANFQGDVHHKIDIAKHQQQASGPLSMIQNIIPDNLFASASSNGNMLQIIFCAIFFALALSLVSEEKAMPVKKFFDSLNEIILKIIDILMITAPFGVFSLITALIVEVPDKQILFALGVFAFNVILGLLVMLCLYAFFVYIFTKRSPLLFLKNVLPIQLLGFSTSSSSATLPFTMERTEEYLGVDEEVSSFVLPLGATINMDGTSLYQAVTALFIAQAFGMDLSFSTQLGIIITATLASIGSAGVPGAAIVTMFIVLAQAGIPEAGLALIFAVDRPLDMCRTAVNITGDVSVAMIVAKWFGKLHPPKKTD